MFRCARDPMVTSKPRLAHVAEDIKAQVEVAIDSGVSVGIYVKNAFGHEHLIPFANIESCRLAPAPIELEPEKRKPGRPVGS